MALAAGPVTTASKAAGSMRKATTPEPVGANRPGKNWVEKSPLGHLPPYVQHVANELIKQGKTRQKAIEMAIGIVRNWSHGHTGSRGGSKPSGVQASTVAAAQLAMRQWGAMRKWAAGRRASSATAKKSTFITPLEDAELIEYLDTLETLDDLHALMSEHGPMEVIVPDDLSQQSLVEDGSFASEGDAATASEAGGGEIAGPIVMKNAANRVAYAAVLVPGERDSDNDLVTEQKIQELAWDFLENHRYMDEEHQLQDAVATPVESYTLPQDMDVEFMGSRAVKTSLPRGTWIMGARIREDRWPDVQSGKLAGFSGMGVRKSDYEAAKAAALKSSDDEFSMTLRRVTFKDLGEDFIMPAVSLVGNPAVPKAKWFALKSKDEKKEDAGGGGFFDRLFGGSTSSKAGEANAREDEEVLEVEISREELNKQVQAETEAVLIKLLGEDAVEGAETDDGETISFESQEELDNHIKAQVAEFLESVEDDEDDGDSEEDSGDSGESDAAQTKETAEAAVKSALAPYLPALEQLGKASKKSSRIRGEDAMTQQNTKTTYEELGRDSFGRKLKV